MQDKKMSTSTNLSRRNLLKGTLALSATGSLISNQALGAELNDKSKAELTEGDIILFQGDSITDAGRKKDITRANNSRALGRGYAAMIAGDMLSNYPDLGLQFYNRGISGNKIPDLAERWKKDAIDLKPAVLSIMVGINDFWHTIAFGSKYKATIKDYETGYRKLIEQSLTDIPGVKIVICEPFELRKWEKFDKYRKVTKKIAEDMKLTYVPFHSVFMKAIKSKGTDGKFWAWDGIHPTVAGHNLMRKTWRETVGI
jgi:lysophospholipase L1-like esterase